MNRMSIVCIVEGHGDVAAVPLLVRRVATECDPELLVEVPTPQRVPRTRITRPGELERAVEFAVRKLTGAGGVLVLIDAEDDCPAQLGPELLQRAQAVRPGVPMAVVLAMKEFEAWFLAAAASLRGRRHLRADLTPPPNPEAVRGAKEWLWVRMTGGRGYSETLDQPAMTQLFDLSAARSAPSFDKCYRAIENLIVAAGPRAADDDPRRGE